MPTPPPSHISNNNNRRNISSPGPGSIGQVTMINGNTNNKMAAAEVGRPTMYSTPSNTANNTSSSSNIYGYSRLPVVKQNQVISSPTSISSSPVSSVPASPLIPSQRITIPRRPMNFEPQPKFLFRRPLSSASSVTSEPPHNYQQYHFQVENFIFCLSCFLRFIV